jgi:hypothetical protein
MVGGSPTGAGLDVEETTAMNNFSNRIPRLNRPPLK